VAGRPLRWAGGLDLLLPDRLQVAGRPPKAVPGERFAQRRPAAPQLGAAAFTPSSCSAWAKARSV